jgi:hypothetical protein
MSGGFALLLPYLSYTIVKKGTWVFGTIPVVVLIHHRDGNVR